MTEELIRRRRSVRTFDGKPISAEDRESLMGYIAGLDNPFGAEVTFRLLDAKEYGLSSPVIVGAETYLAAKVRRGPNFELGYGYAFEKVCLHALTRGLGTVLLAASLSRGAFEKAMALAPDEVLPTATPVGYPAEKRSVRETLMRKGLRADERLPFEKLFFEGDFSTPLPANAPYARALELARWAPSAGNGQPWRAVARRDGVHFFEAKSMKDSPLGDIQKVDVGICLAHFALALEEAGVRGEFVTADPGIAAPENTFYCTTFRRA